MGKQAGRAEYNFMQMRSASLKILTDLFYFSNNTADLGSEFAEEIASSRILPSMETSSHSIQDTPTSD